MYSLVRRYLKTAIAFLAIGLAIGGWMIDRPADMDVECGRLNLAGSQRSDVARHHAGLGVGRKERG